MIGSGTYACALSKVISGDLVTEAMLDDGPPRLTSGAYGGFFDALERLIVVTGDGWSVAEVLWRTNQVFAWIERMTRESEFHEFSVVFVVGAAPSSRFEAALANEFGFDSFDNAPGFLIWRRLQALATLLNELVDVSKTDIQSIRTRQTNRPKRRALLALKNAITVGNSDDILNATRLVMREFRDHNHALDSFCCPPFHSNGNAWRQWISRVVTEGVTHDNRVKARELVPMLNI